MSQDAPNVISKYRRNANAEDDMFERLKYCAVGSNQYSNLEKWVATKKLPTKVCMSNSEALHQVQDDGVLTASAERMIIRSEATEDYNKCTNTHAPCTAGSVAANDTISEGVFGDCCAPVEAMVCLSGYAGGETYDIVNKKCTCGNAKVYYQEMSKCMTPEDYCKGRQLMVKDKNSGECYRDCVTYCMSDDSKENGDTRPKCSGSNRSKCEAKWDISNGKCTCKQK